MTNDYLHTYEMNQESILQILAQPRSASIYVKLFLTKLFPDKKIIYQHTGNLSHKMSVIVVRDIRDSIFSRLRLKDVMEEDDHHENLYHDGKFLINSENDIDKIIHSHHVKYLLESNKCCAKNYKSDSVLVLFYEEFIDNPIIIFEYIENKWKISFEKDKKMETINSLTKEKTKNIIDHPCWGNDHVGDGKIAKWKTIVPEHLHDYFCEK